MKTMLRLSFVASLCAVACGCTPQKIHLAGEESGMKADIQIEGNSGVATWTWGTQQFKQQLEVTENELLSTGATNGGALKLKLHDGTALEFDQEYGDVVCTQSCAAIHMPRLWHQVH